MIQEAVLGKHCLLVCDLFEIPLSQLFQGRSAIDALGETPGGSKAAEVASLLADMFDVYQKAVELLNSQHATNHTPPSTFYE